MSADVLWLIVLGCGLLAGILTGIPVMLIIAGVPLLIALLAACFGHFDLALLQAYPQRIDGIMNNPLLIAVPLFVLMGILLERSRVAERMLINFSRLLGGSSAMLALAVIFVSTLIAASTGIIGATIVLLGMISLPALLRAGVSARMSSGLICAAGTLGQIIPPSIVLILLGDQISNAYIEAQQTIGNFAPEPVSVGDVFAGALIPGLLLVSLYSVYVLLRLMLGKPVTITPIQHDDSSLAEQPNYSSSPSSVWGLLAESLPAVLLICAVLGSILLGVATPTEAAAIGVAGTLFISAANLPDVGTISKVVLRLSALAAFGLVLLKTLSSAAIQYQQGTLVFSPMADLAIALAVLLVLGMGYASVLLLRAGVLVSALIETVRISAMIFGIVIAASMLSLVFRGFEGDLIVAKLLTEVHGGHWGMLLITMLVIFMLGFVLEFVEIIFIVVPIVGPILLQTDFHPVWFAVLIALNLQTSFLTPPFGFALFYYRSVAPKSISTVDIYLSVIPFVIIQIITILLVVMWPSLATWLPSLLFT